MYKNSLKHQYYCYDFQLRYIYLRLEKILVYAVNHNTLLLIINFKQIFLKYFSNCNI